MSKVDFVSRNDFVLTVHFVSNVDFVCNFDFMSKVDLVWNLNFVLQNGQPNRKLLTLLQIV